VGGEKFERRLGAFYLFCPHFALNSLHTLEFSIVGSFYGVSCFFVFVPSDILGIRQAHEVFYDEEKADDYVGQDPCKPTKAS
jgi:hypothetical protein